MTRMSDMTIAAPALDGGHYFGNARVHADAVGRRSKAWRPQTTDNDRMYQNGAEDTDPVTDEEPSGDEGGEALQAEAPAAGGIVLTPGALPLEEGSGTKAKCPSKTVVEKTTDMTPAGIKKGYRTGYGAVAVMKVEPNATDWDGAKIVESLKQTKNTCPKEFGIAPCSGSSTFTVGVEANSSVLGKLPATKNRFYDFHTTRWNKGSLLHDRNPGNIDSCEVECEQTYSCGGTAIGKHTITRTFTKGTSGSRDVTLVAVTKK